MAQPVTLVTGASRGIGRAIAQDLMKRGHQVIGMARSRPEGFEGTFVAVDLADRGATSAALAEVTARHRVLHLVNNAGMAKAAETEQASLDDLDAMMTLNVRAVLQCMQAVLPAMRDARFGRIVNIGSRAGLGKEGRLVYGATKAAVLSMTRAAAIEYARYGITVNCIAPGPVETDMIRIGYPPGSPQRAEFTRQIPAGRFGRPEEIAHACAYFLADEAAFTTGQVLYVCGGLSIGQAPI
jgi:3-oxoacyl-[acyl-carrier protein] reductase